MFELIVNFVRMDCFHLMIRLVSSSSIRTCLNQQCRLADIKYLARFRPSGTVKVKDNVPHRVGTCRRTVPVPIRPSADQLSARGGEILGLHRLGRWSQGKYSHRRLLTANPAPRTHIEGI